MGRRWTAVLVALSTCFLLVNGQRQLDWFVRKSELPKLQVEGSATTEGERGHGVCVRVCDDVSALERMT